MAVSRQREKDMTAEWKKLELDMMRIRAVQGPPCIKNLRKIATATGNFEYYYDTKGYYVWSVAKPGSGAIILYSGNGITLYGN